MTRAILIALTIATLTIGAEGQAASPKKSKPCGRVGIRGEAATWPTYIDRKHRICFRYPPAYKAVKRSQRGCPGFRLQGKNPDANIDVCFLDKAFRESTLIRMAPTGLIEPPEEVIAGKNTFYYYGAGGGGVSYPDTYYFNLRGRILIVYFDGPYDRHSKSPIRGTKAIEQKLLATLEVF